MLKLYHYHISANSRRVWITLLEKDIAFELVSLKLDGDQFQPEFLALNPFHQIPVLVDDGFSVVESLAILDYLEAKYPTPALLPTDAKAVATVRMVEMVTVNELLPAMEPLFFQMMDIAEQKPEKLEQAKQKSATVLTFFEHLLGDSPYFGGKHLTLAEVVAGTVVPWFPSLGMSLGNFPKLSAWSEHLMERASWQKTQPIPELMEAAATRMKAVIAQRQTH
ncbi:glutathione S-transferase family protein [Coleofasciculus sp. F4-SAH-05]|uniref:glutathione S-transferase family protein n=1 Tax=Coleofasciculus sp. F4-SAH-05 TaxID=3069525 RepID=UPI0032F88CF8